VVQSFKGSDSWVILSPIEQSIKSKIEKIGVPLKNWDIQIYRGILTGFNDAFIIAEAKRTEILANCKDIAERKRTDEIIRPILRGRDIKRYSYEWANLYLLFIPWHFPFHNDETIEGVSAKAEREFERQYPAVFSHLLKYKKELCARNKAEVNVRYEWYALQRWAANYWDAFSKPKIMWAETMRIQRENSERFPRFSYSSESIFTDKTCFMAVGDDLQWVLAFLNSTIGRYQLSQTVAMMDNGGYLMQKIYLEQVRICNANKKTKAHLVSLVEKLLNPKIVTEKERVEAEIDTFVFEAFGISLSEQSFLKQALTAPLERR
jgi:TaqI-like C-terminal specificity domain